MAGTISIHGHKTVSLYFEMSQKKPLNGLCERGDHGLLSVRQLNLAKRIQQTLGPLALGQNPASTSIMTG
jgi:hypothetical protein